MKLHRELLITWDGIDWLSKQDVLDFLKDHFSDKLIRNLMKSKRTKLSEICLNNSVAYIPNISDTSNLEYEFYTKTDFATYLASLSQSKSEEACQQIVVGDVVWSRITIYNHDYPFLLQAIASWVSPASLDMPYYEWFSLSEIYRLARVWTVAHELWHVIYSAKIQKKWQLECKFHRLVKEHAPVTKGLERYIVWTPQYYIESFPEAVRMYITNPQYLFDTNPQYLFDTNGDMYMFIKKYFPGINPWQ